MTKSCGEFNSKTVLLGLSLGGTYKYEKYRIPGMISTKSGAILAYFEARMSGSDWADMDIILLRSEDGGETFTEPFVLAEGSETGRTVNNPVMLQGADGVIHFLYCVEYGVQSLGGDAFYRQSRDDGKTWSEPVSVIDSTKPEYHNAFAFGPGHGICLNDGTLLVPVWLVPKSAGSKPASHHPAEVRVFFSRDNGKSFCLSGKIPQGEITDPNETTAVELTGGGVMLNIRHRAGSRAVSYSTNGIDGWTIMTEDKSLADPCCFGSSAKITADDGRQIILFVNCEDICERRNLTVKGSLDGGKTWPLRRRITDGESAYADICVDAAGRIYVMYETDDYRRAVLVRMCLPWHLTSGDFWCSIQHNTRDNCALFALLMGLRVDFNNDFATKTLFLKTFSIFMPVNFVLACFSTRPNQVNSSPQKTLKNRNLQEL